MGKPLNIKDEIEKFDVPISLKRRVGDCVCLLGGIVLVVMAVMASGGVMVLLFPGAGFIVVGLLLLLQSRRTAAPGVIAARLQDELETQGHGHASGPKQRAAQLKTFLKVAEKLAEMAERILSTGVMGTPGRMDNKVVFIRVTDPDNGKHVSVRVLTPPRAPALFLTSLSEDEHQRARACLKLTEPDASEVWDVKCASHEQVLAAVDTAFTEVFGLRDDYAADYRLSCIQPVWVYPGQGR